MSEWIRCPKCSAMMTTLTSGYMCPVCGYRFPAQTVTQSRGTSAEYVKIVRCRYCVYHEDEEPGMVYCPNIVGGWIEEDGYCSRAERHKHE